MMIPTGREISALLAKPAMMYVTKDTAATVMIIFFFSRKRLEKKSGSVIELFARTL